MVSVVITSSLNRRRAGKQRLDIGGCAVSRREVQGSFTATIDCLKRSPCGQQELNHLRRIAEDRCMERGVSSGACGVAPSAVLQEKAGRGKLAVISGGVEGGCSR